MPVSQPVSSSRGRVLLKRAVGAGVVLGPLLLAAALYYAFAAGSAASAHAPPPADWGGLLDRFDERFAEFRAGRLDAPPQSLGLMLDDLEAASVGAQSRLSLLKRRRALARADASFSDAYRNAVSAAALDFPHSAPVCALAAEALLRRTPYPAGDGAAFYRERRERVAALAGTLAASGPLSEAVYAPLAFAFLSLAGFFATPDDALRLPHADGLLRAAAREDAPAWSREAALVDAAILGLLTGGPGAAAPYITALETAAAPPARTRAFLADYYYDSGAWEEAGAAFSRLAHEGAPDAAANREMAADALYLAGWRDNAAQFWRLVADDRSARGEERARALYNLSAREDAPPAERRARLETIFMIAAGGGTDAAVEFPAFILYTRLVPEARGRALLEEGAARFGADGILEVERLRRAAAAQDARKTTGDIWLLLDRYPHAGKAYEWAAWFFERQKRYEQAAFLRRFAAANGVDLPALRLGESFEALRAGDPARAETLLRGLEGAPPPSDGLSARADAAWVVAANLGLAREKRRATAAALECYREALRLLNAAPSSPSGERKSAARLWLRVARCLGMRGTSDGVRAALESALALDGENVNARLALTRLNSLPRR